MTCKQAQLTMALYMEKDPGLTERRCRNFEKHLENCPKCVRQYQGSKYIIDLVKQYWKAGEDTLGLIEKTGQSYKPKMTVEEGWEDLCRRCPDLAESTKTPKSLQLFTRIGAVAACLAIGILTWMVFSKYSKPQTLPHNLASQQVALAPKPSVRIELVSNNGNILIPAKHQIASTDELKTLVINGKHRLMMNKNTVLAIEPLVEHSSIGCQVKLVSGQIYTHVQHDGNPFIVDTAHGKAVITGTTFDVKVTAESTTLVVSEGTVRFESEEGVVNVAAGQTSEIAGQSAPSIPLSCNTAKLTAWATGYKPGPALAQAGLDDNDWYLALPLGKEPIVLEETDYSSWVEQNRGWFKQGFPWIFQLKEALAKEGIEIDYPELLIKTGDVWQFVCLEGIPARFSIIDPNSLLKVAYNYGFNKQWLLENVPAVKSAMEKPLLLESSYTGLNAFEQWLDYIDEARGLSPPTPFYSYYASKYLVETRSLTWFAVKDVKYDLANGERAEVLGLLQKEVTAACQCQNDEMYPTDEQEKPSCDENISKTADEKIVRYIEIVKTTEERIAEYKIDK